MGGRPLIVEQVLGRPVADKPDVAVVLSLILLGVKIPGQRGLVEPVTVIVLVTVAPAATPVKLVGEADMVTKGESVLLLNVAV